MATHSSMLAWEIPWIEENGGLQSMGLQRAGHDRAHTEKQKKWHGPKSSGESAGSQLQPAGVWQETRPQPDPTAISWREWHVSFVLYKGHMGCGRGRAQRKQDPVALVTRGHGGRGSRDDESGELVGWCDMEGKGQMGLGGGLATCTDVRAQHGMSAKGEVVWMWMFMVSQSCRLRCLRVILVTEVPWNTDVHSKGESQERGGKVDEASSQVASN